jgi:hypothetical protein
MAKNSTKQRQPITPFNPEPAGIPDPHRGLRGQPSSAFGGGRSSSAFGGTQPTSGKLPNQEADGVCKAVTPTITASTATTTGATNARQTRTG